MREQLLSAVILISLGLCANSPLAAAETTNLRFRVLANPSFKRPTVKHSVPSVPHQSTPTCERGRWSGTRILNFSNIEKYIPSHRSMDITHLKVFGEPKHPISRNRSTFTNASDFVSRVNGPSPTPYLESVDRFVSLLKQRFKLIESTDRAARCNQVIS
jgi:hypothetical protein